MGDGAVRFESLIAATGGHSSSLWAPLLPPLIGNDEDDPANVPLAEDELDTSLIRVGGPLGVGWGV